MLKRMPDGTAVFMCGPRSDPDEELARWVGEEAGRQGRCSLCLRPLGEKCGGADAICRGTLVPTTRAVGVLRGMVAG